MAADRKALMRAWTRWWHAAMELGLTPEPIRVDAPEAEILRRGKALRKQVLEARDRQKESEE